MYLCEQVDGIIRGRVRKSLGIYICLVISRIPEITFFCPLPGSSKAGCSMRRGDPRAVARQAGVASSSTRAQSH